MQEWLKQNAPVDGEDLERHDKWLCMMWPRLQLLKELLSDDGIAFVSIDDHEQTNLRLMMDEIFGENCFVACIAAVVNLKGSRDNRGFANTHEYVLAYEKIPGGAMLRDLPIRDGDTADWLEDERGLYKRGANLKYSGENAPRERRPNLFFPIYVSESGEVATERLAPSDFELWPISDGKREVTWRWSRERIQKNLSEIMATRSGSDWTLFKKQRPQFGTEPTEKPKSTFYSPTYSATTATNITKVIFENERVFDYPKSPHLIQDLLLIAGVDSDDIILDSFAGSGTTGHAVLALNKEDGGNRKFILVECEDYADSITAERVRRVIRGVPAARDATLRDGLGGSFSYCTLGEPVDLEKMLTGEALPSYAMLAAYLLHTGAGLSADGELAPLNGDWLFHYDDQAHYHLLYEPSLDFLRGNGAMLQEELARRIGAAARANAKTAVVFAAGKHLGQRALTEMGITFCQLPYEIYRGGAGSVV